MADKTESTLKDADILSLQKQWDEILCPICMEHPHNAVVLICTSYEKGCRSYICDTSYRHSNCLDRFRKLRMSSGDNTSGSTSTINENVDAERPHLSSLYGADPSSSPLPATAIASSLYGADPSSSPLPATAIANAVEAHDNFSIDGVISAELDEFFDNPELRQARDGYQASHAEGNMSSDGSGSGNEPEANCLKCPLCRGAVLGWMIVKEARQFMDLKLRSCSRDSCSFSGNYKDLRKHARRVHPMTRPAEVDPSRQQAWRHMERQQEYHDILSALRSAMPGAVVLGDYVIDEGDGLSGDGSGPWWPTTLFLLHMLGGPLGSLDDRRSSRAWRTRRRSSMRRYLWGENLLGAQEYDDWNSDNDILIRRRRRRITRPRHDEEHQQ